MIIKKCSHGLEKIALSTVSEHLTSPHVIFLLPCIFSPIAALILARVYLDSD